MSQPTGIVRNRVDNRDSQSCVRCGVSLHGVSGSRHHRKLRRSNDHEAANLVLLCGSGTTGCHGWVHSNPREARDIGLIVPSWADPEKVPLYLGSLRRWAIHHNNGDQVLITPQRAAEIRRKLGLTA